MRTLGIHAALAATLILLAAAPASADTVYVANNCTGEPTPCTTNLQTALDDTRYDTVSLVANSTFTGEFLIDRAMTLTGASGAEIERASGETYALHIDDATGVTVSNLDLHGRVAINESSNVTIQTCNISNSAVAVHILASDDVTLDDVTIDDTGIDRAVEAQDSTDILIDASRLVADDYGVVASDSTVTVDGGTVDGGDHAVVLQDGTSSTITSSLTATNAELLAGGGNDTTWMWDRTSTSYTNCTPTPSDDVDSNANLVSLTGYTPWGGE